MTLSTMAIFSSAFSEPKPRDSRKIDAHFRERNVIELLGRRVAALFNEELHHLARGEVRPSLDYA